MRPTRRSLLLLAFGLPTSLLPLLLGADWTAVWLAFVAGALLAIGLDALLGLSRRRIELAVETPGRLYVGETGVLGLTLKASQRRTGARVGVLADLHADLLPQEEHIVEVPPAGTATSEIPLVPVRRGTVEIERVWLRWTGPFGLVERRRVQEVGTKIAVVPSVGAVRRAALRFARNRDVYSSERSVKYVSEGSEFDAMREYVPGLDLRTVNWKATARHRKLICEETRAERNHQVIVAFDTGHLMSEPLDGMPKLDHAIHTGLALSHACLRAGDRVGFFAFDEQVRAFAAPRGGVRAFARLQHETARLAYTSAETNFTLGIAELASRLNRRSLVVILTDFVDTVTAELMVENAARLARRHLLIFVSLHDAALDETAGKRPASIEDLHESVVATDFVRERRVVLRRLRRIGVFTIDAPPAAVSTSLLNQYLSIKRRELI